MKGGLVSPAEIVEQYINSLKESFDGLKDSIVGAGNAVNDFMDNIVDVAMGDFSSIGRLLD